MGELVAGRDQFDHLECIGEVPSDGERAAWVDVVGAFGLSPRAHAVVVLEGESNGVHQLVTGRARRVFSVLGQPLAHRTLIERGVDRRLRIRRRGRRLDAQQLGDNPVATLHRGGDVGVRQDRHQASGGQQTAPGRVLEADAHELVGPHRGQSVVRGQAIVDEGLLGGEQLVESATFLDDRRDQQLHLGPHVLPQCGGEVWVRLGVLDQLLAQRTRVEPLAGEVLGESLRFGVGKHALDLCFDRVRLVQLALCGELEQRVVGHRVPQEVGEARGEFVAVEGHEVVTSLGLSELDVVQEKRRLQDRPNRNPKAVLNGVLTRAGGFFFAGLIHGHDPVELAALERASIRMHGEVGQELLGASVSLSHVARQELGEVGRCVGGNRFGSGHVLLDLQFDHGGVSVALERSNALVGCEVHGVATVEAEQVADRMVVLLGRDSSQRRRTHVRVHAQRRRIVGIDVVVRVAAVLTVRIAIGHSVGAAAKPVRVGLEARIAAGEPQKTRRSSKHHETYRHRVSPAPTMPRTPPNRAGIPEETASGFGLYADHPTFRRVPTAWMKLV